MSKKKRKLAKAKPTSAPQPSIDHSPVVHQRDKINWDLHIRNRNDLTDKQKAIIELMMDKKTKVLFLSGPAGTSKTFLAVLCGLMLLQQRRISHVNFIRTVVESASKSLGYLPGDQKSKTDPYMIPLADKLGELLSSDEVKRLLAEERAIGQPVNFLRGASFNAQLMVLEEAQNYTFKEMTTALTRIGQYSKCMVIGDSFQADIGGQSAFQPLFDWFNQSSFQDQGIYCLSFTKDDIVRSGIVRIIVEALEAFKAIHQTKSIT